jgi:hypothetical protein
LKYAPYISASNALGYHIPSLAQEVTVKSVIVNYAYSDCNLHQNILNGLVSVLHRCSTAKVFDKLAGYLANLVLTDKDVLEHRLVALEKQRRHFAKTLRCGEVLPEFWSRAGIDQTEGLPLLIATSQFKQYALLQQAYEHGGSSTSIALITEREGRSAVGKALQPFRKILRAFVQSTALSPSQQGTQVAQQITLVDYFKRRCTTRGDDRGAQAIVRGGARCALQVLHRFSQAVSRGAARCALQVLDRGAHADARVATHVLDRGVQAVARGAARCALHVHGHGARTDACGRSFAVLLTQVSAVGLHLRLVVLRTMPAAVASRCCRRRFQQLACA